MKEVHDTTCIRTGPSPFGSHLAMVKEEATNKLADKTYVVVEDEMGCYATERVNLDSGVTDPYRMASREFRENFLSKIEKSEDATS